MPHDFTHASFFSGVGGLDMGLERAGWRTVSFSEIDPYASSVLAERWPGVPNLGDILHVERELGERVRGDSRVDQDRQLDGDSLRRAGESIRSGGPGDSDPELLSGAEREQRAADWTRATLWSGGFPCQDLSVAGKRAGFAGERSSLAFAFLDLVERHRPPAILLENVPGLLSSHRGRDMAALLGRLVELGYGVGYRILDARHFGVPQRRRRVFIVALDTERGLGAERAAEVLSVGSRCDRHPAAGIEAGPGAAERAGERFDGVGTIPAGLGHHGQSGASSQAVNSGHVIAAHAVKPGTGTDGSFERGDADYILSPPPDPGGVRAPDGLAGRLDDSVSTVQRHYGKGIDAEGAAGGHLIASSSKTQEENIGGRHLRGAELLPLGLDSHRYRCCGNGVVSSVSEWVGLRLAEALA